MPFDYGLQRGWVVDDDDPLNNGRVRLRIPKVFGDEITNWVPGVFTKGTAQTLPVEGEEVWVVFERGDLTKPVWIGWTSSSVPGDPHAFAEHSHE